MAGPLTDGTIADGPNGPIILRGGRWVPLTAAPSAANAPGSIGGVFIPKAPKTREAPTGYRWNGNNLEVIPGGPADKTVGATQPPTGYRFKPGGQELEPIPGGPADTESQTPGDITKTGEDYLATLDPGLAGQVRALSEGRRAFPTGTALKDPAIRELIAAATQYDPTLDATNAATRVATRKDFTSGPTSKNVTSINTALGHLGQLKQAADALQNRSVPVWNAFANWLETERGDPRVKNFTLARDAVANELMRVFRGAGSGSETEIQAWKNDINSSGSPDQLNAEIAKAVELLDSRLQALGDQYSRGMGQSKDPLTLLSPHAQAVYSALGPGGSGVLPDGKSTPPPLTGGAGGTPPGGNPPSPLDPGGGGPPDRAVATGATKRVFDAETAAGLNALVQKGRPYNEAAAFVQSKGFPPPMPREYAAALAWQKNNPNTPYNAADPTRTEPVSLLDQSRATGPGQLLAGIASAGTAGFDDELKGALAAATGGDYTQARDAAQADKEIGAAMHPGYNLAGNVLGGAGMMLAPEMLAGKFAPGALALASRGAAKLGRFATPLGDAAYGAAYGAGEDNNDRLGGAATGAITAPLAGYGARKAVGGLANVISPPAGNFAPLYEQGVFPTIGQRFGKSGLAGRILNTTEQALQSFPLLGSMVAKSRQGARDAYQLGGFNEALGEINQNLPAGMRPGTEAHSFASDAFGKAYDNARGGMTFAPDGQYLAEEKAFNQALGNGTLDASQAAQVRQRINTVVGSRLGSSAKQRAGNVLQGDAYKNAASDLAETQRQWSKTDPLKADALGDYLTIFDNAARRNSDPQAVAALDQADRGYAKLVRLQRASEMGGAGKDAGTFTPLNLASAAKQTAGGVRSGPYLRGDALMQDYADAGRGLADTLPNSGTSERLMTGQVVAGGAGTMAGVPGALAAHPGALAPFALYAPGVGAVVKRMIAPRSVTLPPNLASAADNLALQVNQRAPAIGRLAVPAALNWWEVGQ